MAPCQAWTRLASGRAALERRLSPRKDAAQARHAHSQGALAREPIDDSVRGTFLLPRRHLFGRSLRVSVPPWFTRLRRRLSDLMEGDFLDFDRIGIAGFRHPPPDPIEEVRTQALYHFGVLIRHVLLLTRIGREMIQLHRRAVVDVRLAGRDQLPVAGPDAALAHPRALGEEERLARSTLGAPRELRCERAP